MFLGLSLGYEYTFNVTFIVLFITSILILLLITVWLKGLFAAHNLPFLSFPFILSYWIVSSATSHFSNIQLDESHIYAINEVAKNQSSLWYQFIHSLDNISLFPFALSFFKTLSERFFKQAF